MVDFKGLRKSQAKFQMCYTQSKASLSGDAELYTLLLPLHEIMIL